MTLQQFIEREEALLAKATPPCGYVTKAYLEAFLTLPPERVKDCEQSDEMVPVFLPRQLAEARHGKEVALKMLRRAVEYLEDISTRQEDHASLAKFALADLDAMTEEKP